jgi:DNA-binding protein H-NS
MNAMVDTVDLGDYSINDLHKLAERVQKEIQSKEQAQILELRKRMEEMAGQLGMTPEDVLTYDARKKTSKTPSKVKYRNPANPEQTWTGRGKRPRWLQQALTQGAKLEEFAVAS